MNVKEAIEELKKSKERKFDQTVDLIVNLKGVDVKKSNISLVIDVPNKIKEKKICGFLTRKSDKVRSILEPDFAKYRDKKALKNLVDEYDFFVAAAPLMPKVATTFGKFLGPAGKMPSPQLGILNDENSESIQKVLDKIGKSVKIRVKEPSVKVAIGKQRMNDSQIKENFDAVYTGIVNALPVKKDNVKSVLLKLTMGKPIKMEVK